MKRKLTERVVAGMKPPAKGTRVIYDDSGVGGFGLRVTANGSRAFVLDYRNSHGMSRRHTIGKFPEWGVDEARNEALDLRREIADGADPVERKREKREQIASAATVKDLAKTFLAEHVSCTGEDQQKNVGDIVNKIILPLWGDRKLDAVSESDVRKLHQSMRDRRYRANRVRTAISTMYNFAIAEKLCTHNPARGVKKFPEDKRQTWMTEQELARLDTAISEYGEESAELIRLLMLTGYRRREWMRAEKAAFDMEHRTWTKPSRTVKKGKWDVVTLSKPVVAVLRRVMASTSEDEIYLFPGKKSGKPRTTIRRPWEQVLRSAGLATEFEIPGRRGKPLKRYRMKVRLHDLRHSYCSWLAEQGIPLLVIGKTVGHLDPKTTARYAHIADKSALNAQELFGKMVTRRVQ